MSVYNMYLLSFTVVIRPPSSFFCSWEGCLISSGMFKAALAGGTLSSNIWPNEKPDAVSQYMKRP